MVAVMWFRLGLVAASSVSHSEAHLYSGGRVRGAKLFVEIDVSLKPVSRLEDGELSKQA